MEDDAIQPTSNMVPLALAVFGIVIGAAGLYFGLTANQRLNPIDESVVASTTSSAKIEKLLQSFDTQINELSAQVSENSKTISRLRVYSSQGEQAVKILQTDVAANREQIIKTATQLNEFAAAGFRPAPAPKPAAAATSSEVSPAAPAEATSPSAGSPYVIVAGDNFGKIAAKVGVSVQALMDANPNADPRRLSIGQKIQIPAN